MLDAHGKHGRHGAQSNEAFMIIVIVDLWSDKFVLAFIEQKRKKNDNDDDNPVRNV